VVPKSTDPPCNKRSSNPDSCRFGAPG